MRSATKATVGLVSLGVLAGSYQFGATGENAVSLSASAADTNSVTTQSTSETQPTAKNNSASTATELTPSQTQTATASSAKTSSTTTASKTATSATAEAAAPAPSPTPSKSTTTGGTQTGDAIRYKYGTIQLEVVKSGNSISSINLIQASTKGREWASAPGELVQLALSAQGTSFGNLSGATYTTEAFRAALDSALAKF